MTHLAFQQDFAAKILAANLHRLLTATAHTAAGNAGPPRAEPISRTNRTYAIGPLKPILVGCLLRVSACLNALDDALHIIARTRCRVQPGRASPRPKRTKPRTHSAYKLAC